MHTHTHTHTHNLPRYFTTLPGWFDYSELYTYAVNTAPPNSHLVEVGSFMGKSAAYMMEEIDVMAAQKLLSFSIVDTWFLDANGQPWMSELCPDVEEWKRRFGGDRFYEHVKASLENSPVANRLTAMIRADSVAAAKQFADESLHFVFIDACHHFLNVKADLAAWWPKVQVGGMLAGHDWTDPGPRAAVEAFCSYFNLPAPTPVCGNSWIINKTVFCRT